MIRLIKLPASVLYVESPFLTVKFTESPKLSKLLNQSIALFIYLLYLIFQIKNYNFRVNDFDVKTLSSKSQKLQKALKLYPHQYRGHMGYFKSEQNS